MIKCTLDLAEVKRGEVCRKIAREARRKGVAWSLERRGANHDVYRLGATVIPVPRHLELGDRLAEAIWKKCEPELGERWWR